MRDHERRRSGLGEGRPWGASRRAGDDQRGSDEAEHQLEWNTHTARLTRWRGATIANRPSRDQVETRLLRPEPRAPLDAETAPMVRTAPDPLLTAIRSKDRDTITALLDADPSLVTARAPGGESLVLHACYMGASELADLLHTGRPIDAWEADRKSTRLNSSH